MTPLLRGKPPYDNPWKGYIAGVNRAKVVLYVLLVLALGAVQLVVVSRWLTERSVERLDRELRTGAGEVLAIAGAARDGASLARLRSATGSEVTLLSPSAPPRSTLPSPAELRAVAEAARGNTGRTVGAGRLGPQPLGLPLPLELPALPLLLTDAPAHRVHTVALGGAGAELVALSQGTAELLRPVIAYQWLTLAGLALLLLAGLAVTLLVTDDRRPGVPRELLAAADRLAHGDLDARAPVLAGSMGILAAALNRTADLARAGAATATTAVRTAGEEETSTSISTATATPTSIPTSISISIPTPTPTSTSTSTSTATSTATPTATLVPAPAPSRRVIATGASPRRPAPVVVPGEADTGEQTIETALTSAAMLAGSPVPLDEEDAAWEGVYREFVEARRLCGESPEGVSYDRFREKLRRNRDQLREKHGCRTVRFQVYVKDGKAALKAIPVR